MKYRPDIDGLRAIAVIPVLLFHFGYTAFGGGFVGVDVFFVISGYLITRILAKEMAAGGFTFAGFYERRFRRLLPAYAAVLAASTIAALIWLYPTDLIKFSQSALAGLGVASNLWFWKNLGYFDAAAEFSPLLHIWSLSVEEQFYVAFPLFLLLLLGFFTGRRRPVLWALMAVALFSFATGAWLLKGHPQFVFFFPLFRAWELLVGCLLAFTNPPQPKRFWSETASAIGLTLIAVAVFTFHDSTPFPVWNALLPCVGAALLIYAGNGSVVGKILSWKPVVFVGIISYSLYLWHWPMIVMTRIRLGREPSPLETVLLIGLCFLAAILSWRYVESPFRKSGTMPRGRLIALSLGVMVLLAIPQLAIWKSGGFPGRFDATTLALDRAANPEIPFLDCTYGTFCEVGAKGTDSARFLIWGDSHSLAVLPALDSILSDKGIKAIYTSLSSCPPLVEITSVTNPACRDFNRSVQNLLEKPGSVRHVILAASWFSYASDGTILTLRNETTGKSRNSVVFPDAFAKTMRFLQDRDYKPIVIGQVPWATSNVPIQLLRAHNYGDVPPPRIVDARTYDSLALPFDKAIAEARAVRDFKVIDTRKIFCPEGHCLLEANGVPLYRDIAHLSVRGAYQMLPALRCAIDSAVAAE